MQPASRIGRALARSLGLLLLGALWLGAPRPACAAQAGGRRVLLLEQAPDPFLERVGAEIEKLGFVLVRSAAQDPLESVARAEQAVAALRALPARNGVEVWMADATSGRSLLRQVVVDENPGGPDRDLIALQTAELLRTSLLGEQPRSAEPPAQSRGAKTSDASAAQLLCGALYAPGGARAALELGLSLQHFLTQRWGLALDVAVPLRAGALRGVEGSAKLGAYFAGALAVARFRRHASPYFASAGAGAAALLVKYDGDASEPLRSSTGARAAGAAYLRADAGVDAASWLRFGLRALGGASLQRIQVTFAGNQAGSFGPLFFAGFALAEISLP